MRVKLNEMQEWVEQLLVILSRWRSHDPDSLDEAEILENLFNVLCMMIVCMKHMSDSIAIFGIAAHSTREGAARLTADSHPQTQVRPHSRTEGRSGQFA